MPTVHTAMATAPPMADTIRLIPMAVATVPGVRPSPLPLSLAFIISMTTVSITGSAVRIPSRAVGSTVMAISAAGISAADIPADLVVVDLVMADLPAAITEGLRRANILGPVFRIQHHPA